MLPEFYVIYRPIIQSKELTPKALEKTMTTYFNDEELHTFITFATIQ